MARPQTCSRCEAILVWEPPYGGDTSGFGRTRPYVPISRTCARAEDPEKKVPQQCELDVGVHGTATGAFWSSVFRLALAHSLCSSSQRSGSRPACSHRTPPVPRLSASSSRSISWPSRDRITRLAPRRTFGGSALRITLLAHFEEAFPGELGRVEVGSSIHGSALPTHGPPPTSGRKIP
eukprot:scaffold192784_cov27-Tisochrysis_lutea.AAC.1